MWGKRIEHMKQLKFIKVQRNQYVDVLNQIAAIYIEEFIFSDM